MASLTKRRNPVLTGQSERRKEALRFYRELKRTDLETKRAGQSGERGS
jgi:hypothetical protein